MDGKFPLKHCKLPEHVSRPVTPITLRYCRPTQAEWSTCFNNSARETSMVCIDSDSEDEDEEDLTCNCSYSGSSSSSCGCNETNCPCCRDECSCRSRQSDQLLVPTQGICNSNSGPPTPVNNAPDPASVMLRLTTQRTLPLSAITDPPPEKFDMEWLPDEGGVTSADEYASMNVSVMTKRTVTPSMNTAPLPPEKLPSDGGSSQFFSGAEGLNSPMMVHEVEEKTVIITPRPQTPSATSRTGTPIMNVTTQTITGKDTILNKADVTIGNKVLRINMEQPTEGIIGFTGFESIAGPSSSQISGSSDEGSTPQNLRFPDVVEIPRSPTPDSPSMQLNILEPPADSPIPASPSDILTYNITPSLGAHTSPGKKLITLTQNLFVNGELQDDPIERKFATDEEQLELEIAVAVAVTPMPDETSIPAIEEARADTFIKDPIMDKMTEIPPEGGNLAEQESKPYPAEPMPDLQSLEKAADVFVRDDPTMGPITIDIENRSHAPESRMDRSNSIEIMITIRDTPSDADRVKVPDNTDVLDDANQDDQQVLEQEDKLDDETAELDPTTESEDMDSYLDGIITPDNPPPEPTEEPTAAPIQTMEKLNDDVDPILEKPSEAAEVVTEPNVVETPAPAEEPTPAQAPEVNTDQLPEGEEDRPATPEEAVEALTVPDPPVAEPSQEPGKAAEQNKEAENVELEPKAEIEPEAPIISTVPEEEHQDVQPSAPSPDEPMTATQPAVPDEAENVAEEQAPQLEEIVVEAETPEPEEPAATTADNLEPEPVGNLIEEPSTAEPESLTPIEQVVEEEEIKQPLDTTKPDSPEPETKGEEKVEPDVLTKSELVKPLTEIGIKIHATLRTNMDGKLEPIASDVNIAASDDICKLRLQETIVKPTGNIEVDVVAHPRPSTDIESITIEPTAIEEPEKEQEEEWLVEEEEEDILLPPVDEFVADMFIDSSISISKSDGHISVDIHTDIDMDGMHVSSALSMTFDDEPSASHRALPEKQQQSDAEITVVITKSIHTDEGGFRVASALEMSLGQDSNQIGLKDATEGNIRVHSSLEISASKGSSNISLSEDLHVDAKEGSVNISRLIEIGSRGSSAIEGSTGKTSPIAEKLHDSSTIAEKSMELDTPGSVRVSSALSVDAPNSEVNMSEHISVNDDDDGHVKVALDAQIHIIPKSTLSTLDKEDSTLGLEVKDLAPTSTISLSSSKAPSVRVSSALSVSASSEVDLSQHIAVEISGKQPRLSATTAVMVDEAKSKDSSVDGIFKMRISGAMQVSVSKESGEVSINDEKEIELADGAASIRDKISIQGGFSSRASSALQNEEGEEDVDEEVKDLQRLDEDNGGGAISKITELALGESKVTTAVDFVIEKGTGTMDVVDQVSVQAPEASVFIENMIDLDRKENVARMSSAMSVSIPARTPSVTAPSDVSSDELEPAVPTDIQVTTDVAAGNQKAVVLHTDIKTTDENVVVKLALQTKELETSAKTPHEQQKTEEIYAETLALDDNKEADAAIKDSAALQEIMEQDESLHLEVTDDTYNVADKLLDITKIKLDGRPGEEDEGALEIAVNTIMDSSSPLDVQTTVNVEKRPGGQLALAAQEGSRQNASKVLATSVGLPVFDADESPNGNTIKTRAQIVTEIVTYVDEDGNTVVKSVRPTVELSNGALAAIDQGTFPMVAKIATETFIRSGLNTMKQPPIPPEKQGPMCSRNMLISERCGSLCKRKRLMTKPKLEEVRSEDTEDFIRDLSSRTVSQRKPFKVATDSLLDRLICDTLKALRTKRVNS